MANIPDANQNFETFNAQKVFLYVSEALSDFPGLAKNLKFEAIRAQHIDRLVLTMNTWCVSGRIEDTVTTHKVFYPDGVWQMFKNNYLPHWFKRKFPARMTTVEVRETVNHYFVCPHLVIDEDREHIRFMATGTKFARRF